MNKAYTFRIYLNQTQAILIPMEFCI
ncbi:helix-turn-helix domain-containing protein [Bacillus sp. FSL K6-2944]